MVQVRALVGVIVLCSWVRHLPLTVPLSALSGRSTNGYQQQNAGGGGGLLAMDWHPTQEELSNTPCWLHTAETRISSGAALPFCT